MNKTKIRIADKVCVLAGAILFNQLSYNCSRLIASSWHHYNITLPIDLKIPFIPWTVVIYFGCYFFWAVNYYIAACQQKNDRERFFCADALSKMICFAVFVAFPTTNVRPAVADNNVFDSVMKILYSIDTPDNLLPSIHCLNSWLCWIAVRKRSDVSLSYKIFSLVFAVLVCISTLATKQHVILDVFAGVLLAELCYLIASVDGIRNVYGKAAAFFVKLFKK